MINIGFKNGKTIKRENNLYLNAYKDFWSVEYTNSAISMSIKTCFGLEEANTEYERCLSVLNNMMLSNLEDIDVASYLMA